MRRFLNRPMYPYTAASSRHRVIFIHIPKVAGSSIRKVFGEPFEGRRHVPWWVYRDVDPNRFDSFFKFSFVRDPIDRFISAYEYLRGGGNNKGDLGVANLIRNFTSIDEFVEVGLSESCLKFHPLFMPQSYYLCDWLGNVRVDFVGKYESLHSDLAIVCDLLGITLEEVPAINTTRKKTLSVQKISANTQLMIKDIYALDYKLLENLDRAHALDSRDTIR